MRVVLAIDSFKGSLSSREAAEAAALGIRDVDPEATCDICLVADGGEGTTEAIVEGAGGEYRTSRVQGPLGDEVDAVWGVLPSGVAVIEMSAAAGITLVGGEQRDPFAADTYGVGQMILSALDEGIRRFIIGIGGSATNDGGVGMLRALGCRFLDDMGEDIGRGASALARLSKIDKAGLDPRIGDCSFTVASDVKNPLLGRNGATYVYGPQKGVSDEEAPVLDGYLEKYAALTKRIIPSADADMPGAGAAGGMGFALASYLGAQMLPGVDIVMDTIGLDARVAKADLVITGEGRTDAQSAMGKLPVGVARLAKKYGKPAVALSGSVADGAQELQTLGICATLSVLRAPMSLEQAMDKNNAALNMRAAAGQIASLFRTFGGQK